MTTFHLRSRAKSEAVFGSAARGQSDALSDRDYLIVDDDPALLKRRTETLEAAGWSVAAYTFKKLRALHASGALFLQHLKDEARVLVDEAGQLGELLATFEPKPTYLRDLCANSKISHLVATRPDTPRGHLWACDVLYVTVRNFGILWLADRKRYHFAYSDVIDGVIGAGLVRAASRSALLKLRLLKGLYRSGETFESAQVIDGLADALASLPQEWFPTVSEAVPARAIVKNLRVLPKCASSYYRLRNLEKGFTAMCAMSRNFALSGEAQNLKAWIENPRAYANLASHLESAIVEDFQKTLETCAACYSVAVT